MNHTYIYIFGAIGIILIILVFLSSVKKGVFLLFCGGVSIQYLESIPLGGNTAFDGACIGIPILLFLGLILSKNSVFGEFSKDKTIIIFFCLSLILFFSGVLLSELFFKENSLQPLMTKIGICGKFINGFVIFFIVSSVISNDSDTEKLVNCMLFMLIVPGIIAYWEIVTGNTKVHGDSRYAMPWAFFHHPNVIAYCFVMLFPLSLLNFRLSNFFRSKIFWGIITLLLFLLIVLTYRRTVWIGLFAELIAWIYFFKSRKEKIVFAYFFVLAIIPAVTTTLLISFSDRLSDIPVFIQNFPEVFYHSEFNYLFSGRWGIFRLNILYFFNQSIITALFGNGIGSMMKVSIMGDGYFGGNHNCYLILLIEFGLIALIMYLTLYFLIIKRALFLSKSQNIFINTYAKMYLVLIFGYLVMGLGTHLFYNVPSGVWVFWGLSGAIIGLYHNEKATILQNEPYRENNAT